MFIISNNKSKNMRFILQVRAQEQPFRACSVTKLANIFVIRYVTNMSLMMAISTGKKKNVLQFVLETAHQ